MIGALFPVVLLASAATAEVPCNPIAGWNHVLADEHTRWIVIGEMHGNAESPEIFADAVCLTAQQRSVVVALEQPDSAQPAIDAFLASDGGAEAQEAFLADPMWHWEFKDGRTSQAMFRLFRQLQRMHQTGQVKRVVAFQPTAFEAPPSRAGYEEMLAHPVAAAASDGDTVLVLVGGAHASFQSFGFGGEDYPPMAAVLPRAQTITLNIENNGGETWACTGQPVSCGAIFNGRMEVLSAVREVRLDGGAEDRYSGQLFLGTATTVSPPQ
jgi:hypothetical protein